MKGGREAHLIELHYMYTCTVHQDPFPDLHGVFVGVLYMYIYMSVQPCVCYCCIKHTIQTTEESGCRSRKQTALQQLNGY